MAKELQVFTVTIPAGTTAANPHKAAITTNPRVVTQVTVRVPPGPRGVVGFAVGVSGVPLYPINPGEWVVTDNEAVVIPVQGAPTSGAWYLIGYNTGTYPHTLQVRFLLDLTGTAGRSTATPVTVAGTPTSVPVGGSTGGSGGEPTVPVLTVAPPPVVTTPTPVAPPPITAPTGITTPPPVSAPPPVASAPPIAAPPALTTPPVLTAAAPTIVDLTNKLWYVLGAFTPQGLYVGRTVGAGAPVGFTWIGGPGVVIGRLPPPGATGVGVYTPITTPLTEISAPHGPVVAPWSQGYTA